MEGSIVPALLTLLSLLALLAVAAPVARAQSVDTSLWVTDGAVYDMLQTGNTLYIGGSFNMVGPATGSGVPLDTSTGAVSGTFPKVVGNVRAVIPDGSGGWYIGGIFQWVGGLPRSNLARILADGSVSTWNPGVTGETNVQVNALALSGSTLYIGGYFSVVGGIARTSLAAVDVNTGVATVWAPSTDGTVVVLAISGSLVYVGGNYGTIGGKNRASIAAVDATTGVVTNWSPFIAGSAYVGALAVNGSTIYAGGYFNGGASYAKAWNTSSAAETAWAPASNGGINALAISGTTIYAGGSFTTIGGQTRRNIAALDLVTGTATAWNPAPDDGNVQAILVKGSVVYVGGAFSTIGGQPRRRLAAIDAVTGLATPWDPAMGGMVAALAGSGSTLYAGGSFTTVGGLNRSNLAAINLATGTATTWNPGAAGGVTPVVNDLALLGGTLYIGGGFETIAGQARRNLAALDLASGTVTAWNPSPDDHVRTLEVTQGITVSAPLTIYAGGKFRNAGGQPRRGIVALDGVTGLATAWNPAANDDVHDIALRTNFASGAVTTVYVVGRFTNIGGQPRSAIAALNAAGVATPWDPNATGVGFSAGLLFVSLSGNTVNVAGDFTGIGGQPRRHIAVIDATTGAATSFDAALGVYSEYVHRIAIAGSVMYIGGGFIDIGGKVRTLAAVNAVTGAPFAWDPDPTHSVASLLVSGPKLYVGGVFPTIARTPQASLAALSAILPSGLDVDASITASKYDALTDGLLILRYLFGLTGPSLTSGALGPTATRTDPAAVIAYLDGIRSWLDIDDSGSADALSDGLIMVRYMSGLRGANLVVNAIAPSARRKTGAEVEAYMRSLVP